MSKAARKLAPLLFGSGLCALVYQVAWFREFRMVFGASTAANAAVLAIFIGGLGAGGLVLGQRADRHPEPVKLYARLELLVALSAAATPAALWLARRIYVLAGGTPRLGMLWGSCARLLLSGLVLGVPTFLMGGTLPAAARGVETDSDQARRSTGLLYGLNTLGAVTGCSLSTFFLLEAVGTRMTIWLACAINVLVASAAWLSTNSAVFSPQGDFAAGQSQPDTNDLAVGSQRPAPLVFSLAAAAAVGFAFFLMEMVWYRMLGPILGGTVFTFGLILAIALLGIGLGGAFYGVFGSSRPATLLGFAYTCLGEAVLMILPFALGDRVATLTLMLRPLGVFGFTGLLASWAAITALVVLPAAFVSGVQFPMLIALLGRGRSEVGAQIGLTYAFNTIGAILGSLAGGFGLMPVLTAPGCWRLVASVLAALGLTAVVLSIVREGHRKGAIAPVVLCVCCALMGWSRGPSAVWRHSPIGVGRVDPASTASPRALRGWMNDERRAVVWEQEGVESTVALNANDGWAFVVNGKIDGNARGDAPTQVMGGLVGALLHSEPKSALVIGLGTGSTAGWLASIPSMSRVDVVELEPAVLWVARRCMSVNRDVMNKANVHVTIGDAREVLVTTQQHYDIIFSEPSNPYRAGVASLFTREYYEAVSQRLGQGGMLLQWVQAYNVDAQAVRTIYATLGSVFPEVETWELAQNDLLLVASKTPLDHDIERLRARIAEEPFKTALASAWRSTDVEGLFAHYVANSSLAAGIARAEQGRLNTDDRTLVEFGFARTASDKTALSSSDIRKVAHARAEDQPRSGLGSMSPVRIQDEWMAFMTEEESQEDPPDYLSSDQKARAKAELYYQEGQSGYVVSMWRSQPREPSGPTELAVLGEALADLGDERAREYAERLRAYQPIEADAITARLLVRRHNPSSAIGHLEKAFRGLRTDPWAWPPVTRHAFDTLIQLVDQDATQADRAYAAISHPFVAYLHEDLRRRIMLRLARQHELREPCPAALKALEPNVPWEEETLRFRHLCYAQQGGPWEHTAKEDLETFLAQEPMRFAAGLSASP